jgi:hypothetical protein
MVVQSRIETLATSLFIEHRSLDIPRLIGQADPMAGLAPTA